MLNKKITKLLALTVLSTLVFTGCTTSTNTNPNDERNNAVIEERTLESFSEDGIKLLKNNYTTTEDMKFALKNIGTNISEMKFKTYSGKEIGIKDFKGKKIILEISQTTCESCREADPIVHEIMKDKDVELVPVFLNSTKEMIDEYYSQLNLEMPKNVIIDEEKVTKDKFNLTVTPTYIFVDEEGTISLVKQTFVDKISFEDDLDLAFGEDKIYDYLLYK